MHLFWLLHDVILGSNVVLLISLPNSRGQNRCCFLLSQIIRASVFPVFRDFQMRAELLSHCLWGLDVIVVMGLCVCQTVHVRLVYSFFEINYKIWLLSWYLRRHWRTLQSNRLRPGSVSSTERPVASNWLAISSGCFIGSTASVAAIKD